MCRGQFLVYLSLKCHLYCHKILNVTITVNKELEGIWKEDVMSYFKILTLHVSEGTEKNEKKIPTSSVLQTVLLSL
jgi:hypothetical protein